MLKNTLYECNHVICLFFKDQKKLILELKKEFNSTRASNPCPPSKRVAHLTTELVPTIYHNNLKTMRATS